MSSQIDLKVTQWRQVEVGRIVLLSNGPFAGRLAAIVEIIDHKRVLIDGPLNKSKASVPRQEISLNNVTLTHITIPKLPRAIGKGALTRAWEKAEVESKWSESAWAKKIEARSRRRNLTDFERFKVMKYKKQLRFEVRRAHGALKKAAK